MEQTTAMTATVSAPLPTVYNPNDNWLDASKCQHIFNLANKLTESNMVPAHLQKKPIDVFLVLQLAFRAKIDPWTALQKMFVVHGKPGMESQLVIAMANSAGVFDGPIRYRKVSDAPNLGYVAYAKTRDGDTVEGPVVDMEMARRADWTKNKAYQTMPELMIRYRAAVMFIRQTCPEVTFGMYAKEELEDIEAVDNARKNPKTDREVWEEQKALAAKTIDVQAHQEPAPKDATDTAAPKTSNAPRKTTAPQTPPQHEAASSNKPAAPLPPSSVFATKAYETINTLLVQNNNKPEVAEKLKLLAKGTGLRDSDSGSLAKATREANAGRFAMLDEFLAFHGPLKTEQASDGIPF